MRQMDRSCLRGGVCFDHPLGRFSGPLWPDIKAIVVGKAVGICRHSIVIHIWGFESGRRCVVVAEFCFITIVLSGWRSDSANRKVCVYPIRVGAAIVGADNAPGREWMPDVGLRRIILAVIVQCMPQPSRRGTECPPRRMAMQDKFGRDVVASRNVRVAYHKSAIITHLRSSNPTVDSDIPYTVNYLYPILNSCIRGLCKVHSKVVNIAGELIVEIIYIDCLLCGLIQIIRRSNDYCVVWPRPEERIIDIGVKITFLNQAGVWWPPVQIDRGSPIEGISEHRNSNIAGDVSQNIDPLLRNSVSAECLIIAIPKIDLWRIWVIRTNFR